MIIRKTIIIVDDESTIEGPLFESGGFSENIVFSVEMFDPALAEAIYRATGKPLPAPRNEQRDDPLLKIRDR